jgi:hypothetical protein
MGLGILTRTLIIRESILVGPAHLRIIEITNKRKELTSDDREVTNRIEVVWLASGGLEITVRVGNNSEGLKTS